jgi:serine/threonine protein kinase/tetratricopeptide (TPR) repeat protein
MTSPAVLDGRYRLDALAASGGMGSVYRAFDLVEERTCAVKLLQTGLLDDRSATTRVQTEVEALASLEHDAIVRYLGSGSTEGGPYLVMEWVEGETLRAKLARDGVRIGDAFLVAARLVRALAAVHAAGVVHRDVTPRNIMLEGGSVAQAKLVDFGIARRNAGPGLTASGVRIGTPRYMAPEQILNARRVDGRADVFSLGCILFEMLTGRRVFEGDDEVAVLARVLIEDAPRPSSARPNLLRAIDELVARLLARDARQRPLADEALAGAMDALAASVHDDSLPPLRVFTNRAPLPATLSDAEDAIPPSVLTGPPTRFIVPDGGRSAAPPTSRAPLVGRARELAEIAQAAAPGAIVSVWGPVGSGKSRLFAELVRTLARDTQRLREVVPVDLAGVKETDVLVARVANALRLGAVDVNHVVRALASDPMVLMIDVPDTALDLLTALVLAWREAAPETSFLIASRRRLDRATVAFEIKPLDPEASLELLRQRIRERGHDEPADVLRTSVIPRLEGNPLLIELAAARYDVLGAQGLATRLAQPLEVFEGARSPEYRSTLEEALEDSWSNLGEAERRALAVASSFAGTFDFAAAEALLGALGVRRALDVLQTLRDRSLLLRRTDDRFSFSEPVRAFAARKRVELGVETETRLAHARIVVALAEAAATELARSGTDEARARLAALEAELEVISERMTTTPHGGALALRALLAADPVLVSRSPLVVHLRRLEAAIGAAANESADPELMQRARQARGRILALRGRHPEARAELEDALTMAREAGDPEREASALLDLGVALHGAGDLAKAEECYEAVLALRVRFENAPVEARALGNLGAIAHDKHDLSWAYRRYVEAIALVESSGDQRLLGVFLGNLAVLDRERGDLPMAKRRFVRALEALEQVADIRLSAVALGNLGVLELERNRLEIALGCLTRAREMLERVGDTHSEALALARQAAVLSMLGRLEDARKSLFLSSRAAGQNAMARELAAIAEGFLDAEEGRVEDARAKITAACRPSNATPSLIDRSDDARALVRILERRLSRST